MLFPKFFVGACLLLVSFVSCYCMETERRSESAAKALVLFQGRRKSAPPICGHSSSTPSLPQMVCRRAKNVQQATLFCDLRGFTSMCERLSEHPDIALRELLSFHEEFARIIKIFGGKVSNTYGDALFAVFQAEEPDSEAGPAVTTALYDKHQACIGATCAALQMLNAIRYINGLRVNVGLRPFCFGIGVDFGMLCRSSLSGVPVTVGSPANIAQRLEDLNKEQSIRALLGCADLVRPFSSMIISGTVYDLLPEDLSYRYNEQIVRFNKSQIISLGPVALRGISAPIHAYGLGFLMP